MKRWIVNCCIGAYLAALAWGVFAHTFEYKQTSHPVMYYLVWDMYSGWSAYEHRTHIIGKGESGQYYRLSPPPWGGSTPWSSGVDRATCDHSYYSTWKFAENTLRHTRHEPIVRVYAVEEVWAHQYNAPDRLWHRNFAEPKDFDSYFNLVKSIAANGETEQEFPTWHSRMGGVSVWSNPRLKQEAQKLSPMFQLDGYIPSSGSSSRDDRSPGYEPLAH